MDPKSSTLRIYTIKHKSSFIIHGKKKATWLFRIFPPSAGSANLALPLTIRIFIRFPTARWHRRYRCHCPSPRFRGPSRVGRSPPRLPAMPRGAPDRSAPADAKQPRGREQKEMKFTFGSNRWENTPAVGIPDRVIIDQRVRRCGDAPQNRWNVPESTRPPCFPVCWGCPRDGICFRHGAKNEWDLLSSGESTSFGRGASPCLRPGDLDLRERNEGNLPFSWEYGKARVGWHEGSWHRGGRGRADEHMHGQERAALRILPTAALLRKLPTASSSRAGRRECVIPIVRGKRFTIFYFFYFFLFIFLFLVCLDRFGGPRRRMPWTESDRERFGGERLVRSGKSGTSESSTPWDR